MRTRQGQKQSRRIRQRIRAQPRDVSVPRDPFGDDAVDWIAADRRRFAEREPQGIGGEAGGTGVGAGLPYDAAILRFNASGVFQWRRVYTGTLGDYDRFNEVKVASNGDVVGCGFIANTNSDGLVARLTSANVQVFQDTYNTGYVGGTALNENDATGVALDGSGKTIQAKIYPAFGLNHHEGHLLESRGPTIWAEDVKLFLERYL